MSKVSRPNITTPDSLRSSLSRLRARLARPELYAEACSRAASLMPTFFASQPTPFFNFCTAAFENLGNYLASKVGDISPFYNFINAIYSERACLREEARSSVEQWWEIANRIHEGKEEALPATKPKTTPSKPHTNRDSRFKARVAALESGSHPDDSPISASRQLTYFFSTAPSPKSLNLQQDLVPAPPDPGNEVKGPQFPSLMFASYPFFEFTGDVLLAPARPALGVALSAHQFSISPDLYLQYVAFSSVCEGRLSIRLLCIDYSEPNRCIRPPFETLLLSCNGITLTEPFAFASVKHAAELSFGIPLDQLCSLGLNALTLQGMSDYALHMHLAFSISVVRVVPIDELSSRVVTYRTLTPESCAQRVRDSFSAVDDVVEVSRKISLRDPISFTRVSIAARGMLCSHLQCFDLVNYLRFNQSSADFRCLICSGFLPAEALVVDAFLQIVLNQLPVHEDIDDIIVFPDASWRPVISPSTTALSDSDDAENPDVTVNYRPLKRKNDGFTSTDVLQPPTKMQKIGPETHPNYQDAHSTT